MENKPVSIGIDIGGTKICAAAIKDGAILDKSHCYKTPDTAEGILDTILKIVEDLKQKYNAEFVGIATAGAVDINNSRVVGSTGNLPKGYSSIEFKKIIEEKYGLKTFIENDANAAAYAEYSIGASKEHKNTIIITLGTGIGGGIIVEGNLLRGKSGAGAEVGHIQISWEGKRKCTCGAINCWEAYASGTGYAINAREMAKELPEFKTSCLKDKNPDELTTYDIIVGLKKNDEFSKKVHERWEQLVSVGLVSLANVFDPESIVLSGGMAKFVDFEKMEKTVNSQLVVSDIKLLHARTDNEAGMIGAAILAQEKLG